MRTFLLAIALFSYMAADNAYAAPQRQRDRVLLECSRQATAMKLAPKTIRRKNFIMDCMIDRGFQGSLI
jgi:hypothetical protein